MLTETLLVVGVITFVVFVAVLLVEGARRPGYDPVFHTGSELSLGDRGWIQRANFLQMGVGVLAVALAVHRTLDAPVGSTLLATFGMGMLAAGVFVPDPVRGYPPGSSTGTPEKLTWQHQVHSAISGPVAFFALFGACLTLAGSLEGGWRLYTVVTAGAGLALTATTALAWQKDAAYTGLVQRGLILVYWSWLGLLSVHLL